MSAINREPLRVFYSYSQQDEEFRVELEKHLTLLRRQNIISEWHNRNITPGEEWATAIDEHLRAADIILLLISSDFLASDYCYKIEMETALARHQKGEARVIPIILRPSDLRGAPFADLKVLPDNNKAVTSWKNRDEVWTEVVQGIRKACEELILSRNLSTPESPTPEPPKPLLRLQQLINDYEHGLLIATGASFLVAVAVIFLRSTGILQPVELAAYDNLVKQRPSLPDERITIIQIDEEDVEFQRQNREKIKISATEQSNDDYRPWSLSSDSLLKVLNRLNGLDEENQPIAIALDLKRPQEIKPADFKIYSENASQAAEQARQLEWYMQKPNFFAACMGSVNIGAKIEGFASPPGIEATRTGFTNLIRDINDDVVRRNYIMYRPTNSPCKGEINAEEPLDKGEVSLSFQLAAYYLDQQKNIKVQRFVFDQDNWCTNIYFNNGSVLDTIAMPPWGGYQGHFNSDESLKPWGGCQIMLNYRSSTNPATILSLKQVLELDSEELGLKVKNRVVLIGTNHRLTDLVDFHSTPYGEMASLYGEMTGVFIIAQQMSQVLDAVLKIEGGRGLIYAPSLWGDYIWIISWSFLGTFVIYLIGVLKLFERFIMSYFLNIVLKVVTISVLSATVPYWICSIAFSVSIWLPLVPAIIAFSGSGILLSFLQFSSLVSTSRNIYLRDI